jgi:hypothetical protein
MSMTSVGCRNHMVQHDPSLNRVNTPTDFFTSLPEQISVWGCIHMTASHNRRYWNTSYMYDDDLLWVWSGWDAAIIIYSLIQVRNQVNHLLLILHLSQSRYQCEVASIWLPATIEGIETLYICMKTTCYEYEVGGVPQSYGTAWYKKNRAKHLLLILPLSQSRYLFIINDGAFLLPQPLLIIKAKI